MWEAEEEDYKTLKMRPLTEEVGTLTVKAMTVNKIMCFSLDQAIAVRSEWNLTQCSYMAEPQKIICTLWPW